jgi:hypothetical protein
LLYPQLDWRERFICFRGSSRSKLLFILFFFLQVAVKFDSRQSLLPDFVAGLKSFKAELFFDLPRDLLPKIPLEGVRNEGAVAADARDDDVEVVMLRVGMGYYDVGRLLEIYCPASLAA